MQDSNRKRARVGLWLALILSFVALLGHNVYLTAHRPRYMDPAAGYVEVLNNRGAINFITVGDAWVQRVLFGIAVVAFLGVAWLDFSRWYRRTVPKIKGL